MPRPLGVGNGIVCSLIRDSRLLPRYQTNRGGFTMRSILLFLLGVPIPIIILNALFSHC